MYQTPVYIDVIEFLLQIKFLEFYYQDYSGLPHQSIFQKTNRSIWEDKLEQLNHKKKKPTEPQPRHHRAFWSGQPTAIQTPKHRSSQPTATQPPIWPTHSHSNSKPPPIQPLKHRSSHRNTNLQPPKHSNYKKQEERRE